MVLHCSDTCNIKQPQSSWLTPQHIPGTILLFASCPLAYMEEVPRKISPWQVSSAPALGSPCHQGWSVLHWVFLECRTRIAVCDPRAHNSLSSAATAPPTTWVRVNGFIFNSHRIISINYPICVTRRLPPPPPPPISGLGHLSIYTEPRQKRNLPPRGGGGALTYIGSIGMCGP